MKSIRSLVRISSFICFSIGVVFPMVGCDRSSPQKTSPAPSAATQPTTPMPREDGAVLEDGSPGMNRYVHKEAGFSIEFPQLWKFEKATPPVIVQVTSPKETEMDTFLENVYIVKKRVIQGTTLDLHINYLRQNIATVAQDGQLEESNEMNIGGERCAWIIAMYTINQTRCKSIRYFFLRGQDLYEITCTSVQDSFDGYRPAFDKIAKTFRLL